MAAIFTNGKVALTDDLIFGVSVLTEDGWIPISDLDPEDLKKVQVLLDWNPACPDKIKQAVYGGAK